MKLQITLSSLVRSSARWAAARRAHWRAKPQAARATGQEPKAKSQKPKATRSRERIERPLPPHFFCGTSLQVDKDSVRLPITSEIALNPLVPISNLSCTWRVERGSAVVRKVRVAQPPPERHLQLEILRRDRNRQVGHKAVA